MEAADYNSSAPSALEAKRSTGEISARLPSGIFWSNSLLEQCRPVDQETKAKALNLRFKIDLY
jgi:hypothetical protein